ncbi:Histone deacetylase complex subunit SAP30L [Holothuria leucospilota]|uniref:Histone deacetylase complex subunit SAP30L n=1 Tax=Holothuria leucospilota TaxID=206669 RepID=A0A9Q1BKV5_HOLLE|nr:Histone deacetylase complex subunit SAP30L [Holothuria leucospilota]
MPYCKAYGCTNHSGRVKKSMFKLPDPDRRPEIFKQWIDAINTDKFKVKPYVVNKHDVLCEDHFTPDCFEQNIRAKVMGFIPRGKRLKEDAVPSIFLPRPALSKPSVSTAEGSHGTNDCFHEDMKAKLLGYEPKHKLLKKDALPSLFLKGSLSQKSRHLKKKKASKVPKVNGFAASVNDDGGDVGHGQICCLMDDGVRCKRPAGNACYSKRIAKTVQQRKLKLNIDHSVRHIYICDFHKSKIHSVRSNKRKRKASEDDGGGSPIHDTDVPEIVAKHFKTLPVKEKEALTYFIYMVKNNKSRLDQKSSDNV